MDTTDACNGNAVGGMPNGTSASHNIWPTQLANKVSVSKGLMH